MSRPFNTAAAAFAALLMGTLAAPYLRAEENAKTVNGLFPNEIISADELKNKMDAREDFLLLDARPKKTYEAGHLPGAGLPRTEEYYRQEQLFADHLAPSMPDQDKALVEGMQSIPKDKPIVTYCNSNCHASAALALKLKGLGFTKVQSMEEGYQEWEKKGFPVVKPPEPGASA